MWMSAGAGIEALWVTGSSLGFIYVGQGFSGSVRGRLGGQDTTVGTVARVGQVEGTQTVMASAGLEEEPAEPSEGRDLSMGTGEEGDSRGNQ